MAMLRTLLVLMIGLSCHSSSLLGQEKSVTMDKEKSIEAVSKAYDALNKAQIENRNKKIVISPQGKYIVVCFLNTDESMYGGQAHVVYDPDRKEVVRVVGEQ